jgi:4-hydroxythreonine-4-phosphate dehydrogenase
VTGEATTIVPGSPTPPPVAVALTPGCPAGVGLELLPKALVALTTEGCLKTPVAWRFCASPALLLEGCRRAGVAATRHGDVVSCAGQRITCLLDDVDDHGLRTLPGRPDPAALVCQREGLLRGIESAVRGEVQALVTAPVRKAALVVHGVQFPGQTELVHAALRDDDGPPLMVFSGAPFLLGLHTVHVPLRDVSALCHASSLRRSIVRLAQAARRLLAAPRPRLAVLGINPHAGEGGLLGREELEVVEPLMHTLRTERDLDIDLVGPVPADGFFADVARAKRTGAVRSHVDAVLAMHHDQGLGPYKLLCDGDGVNITWGLRVPRTSPDHGTADVLAGTGQADPSSTKAAILTALRLALPPPS